MNKILKLRKCAHLFNNEITHNNQFQLRSSTLRKISSLTSSPTVCTMENNNRSISSSRNQLGIFSKSDSTLLERLREKLGMTETPKSVLRAAGYIWFIKIADEIKYVDFFEICNLEDTFNSWFYVLELHIWLLAARLMHEGPEGRIIRNSMVKAMWGDIDVRTKKLEGALPSARRAQVSELNEQFQACLCAYDEGLLGSDKILAGALWRRFLQGKYPETEEEMLKQIVALEMLVIYVRQQFSRLHKLNRHELFFKREVKWEPFKKELIELVDKK